MRPDLYATNPKSLFPLFLPNRILFRANGAFNPFGLSVFFFFLGGGGGGGGTFQPLHAYN